MSNLIEIEGIGFWDNDLSRHNQEPKVYSYVNDIVYSSEIDEGLSEKELCKSNGEAVYRYTKMVYLKDGIRVEVSLTYTNPSNSYNCMTVKKIDAKLFYHE